MHTSWRRRSGIFAQFNGPFGTSVRVARSHLEILGYSSVVPDLSSQQTALVKLGQLLQYDNYTFVTPTPETHRRVLARPASPSDVSLTDIFGWNRVFSRGATRREAIDLLAEAGCLEERDGLLRALVRFSTLDGQLFAHSSFPTEAEQAVFFGPDTYRFARAILGIRNQDQDFMPRTVVDIGAGSGAGGLFCQPVFPNVERLVLCDVNPAALNLAQVNSVLNGVKCAETAHSDVLRAVSGQFDLIFANPPYLVDSARRTYRHGGGDWGCDLGLRIVEEGLSRLAPGGKLLLYTGTPIVRGEDMFFKTVRPLLDASGHGYRYEELDPDVFGEELAQAPYDEADRIAVVMLLVEGAARRGGH